MKTLLRPQNLDEVLRKNVPTTGRHDVMVNPEGGFFEVKNLTAATRRAAKYDIVHIPAGIYTPLEITKPLELRSAQTGPVQLKGPIRIRTEGIVVLNGVEIHSELGTLAVIVEKGTVVFDDCSIHGGITAGSPGNSAQIFLKNCLTGHAEHGIFLSDLASAELSTTRIAECQTGIYLSPGTSCAVHDSCIESCVTITEEDPGAAILAEGASVYCEGVTFSKNSIGMYLSNCGDIRVLSCHFHASETAAIIASNTPTGPATQIQSCTVANQSTARCAQIALTGGAAIIKRTNVQIAPPVAISLEQTRAELHECRFTSRDEPAIDAHSSHLTARSILCLSENSAGLAARSCQGLLRGSRFVGTPPTAITDSMQLISEACTSAEHLSEIPTTDTPARPESTIEGVMHRLEKSISQDVVRNELERMLRLAHAGQQRREAGLPEPAQSYHCVFMGPPGTGKHAAAQMLAHGLHAFGVIEQPEVHEIALQNGLNGSQAHNGVLFVRARDLAEPAEGTTDARQQVEEILANSAGIVVLEGERDELRRLLRQSPVLDRTFRHMLFFTSFGPLELAALFVQLCERDRIPISLEARRTILLALHLYCERKDKRFANTHGVETLYELSRRRYLERCSLAESVDLELESRDFDIPQDKMLLSTLDRSPAFVSFCPACTRETPWLPGLDPQTQCLHCGAIYTANWGVWKDSSTYRRTRESLDRPVHGAELPQRASLPPIH